MGLLDMMGYGESPFGQFVDQNRAKLGALGAGLAGGTTLGGGLALGTQYMQQAQLLDAQRRQQQTDEQQRQAQLNQTMEWLRTQAANDPFYGDLLKGVESEAMTPSQAWEMALDRRYQPQGNDLFGTPVYIQKPDGSTGVAQLGKDGQYHEVDTPEGINVLTPTTSVDYGTGTKILNRGGGTVADVPKDIAGAESEKARGKISGEALANLPKALASSQQTVAKIDQLMFHPGLGEILGPIDQYKPNWLMSENGRDAMARYDQLQGTAFLEAYQMLKGGGQITEVEGVKAENAMARMARAQSVESFRQALKDFRDAVQQGAAKLQEVAGQAPATAPAASPAGDIDDLLQKYGQ